MPITPAPLVCIVEDDRELREGLAEYMGLNGLPVAEADSGLSFRRVLQEYSVDVAIIDINLPDISGFHLARELSGRTGKPGIILLTARSGQQDRIRGYGEGADLYMTKPVDGQELLLAVRNLAARVRGRAGGAEQAAWRLDVAGMRLVAPTGGAVVLSPREVLLLEQFVPAAGQPVSRRSLDAVMGYGEPGSKSRGLDQALARLHEKARRQNVRLPLQVIHAIGIRFAAPLSFR